VPADSWERAAALADAAPPIAQVVDTLRVNRAPWAARLAAGGDEAADLPTHKFFFEISPRLDWCHIFGRDRYLIPGRYFVSNCMKFMEL
jgi:hypothetical protein